MKLGPIGSKMIEQTYLVVILSLAIWWISQRWQSCNDSVLQIYQEQNQQYQKSNEVLIEVIKDNTEIMRQFSPDITPRRSKKQP